ncbi:tryptophan-rich sensory protein [Hymenobacter sedentarius]|uniref:tryptophan-rich sensory protein n=1 Tax=Hymenobacter sedentarius TaxID=1411621 RepID=UPI000AFFDD32|nr:tryptophan-rich sensory protein [Hymenobacter sedentarius]
MLAPSPAPDNYASPNRTFMGRLWRWLTALAIFGNIFLSYYSNTHPFSGQTMGMVSARYPTLLTPAGYAFSIWGLIFLGLAVYAIWQLLPAQRQLSLPDALAKPLTLANVATGAWVVLFAYEQIIPSVGVMLLILLSLIVAYGRTRRRIFAGAAPAWIGVPFSLYLGWISVASVINITIGLRELGWQTAEGLSVTMTLGLLLVIVALGLIISRVFRDMAFPLVLAWALVAIWVVRLREIPELGWAALAGAVAVTVLGIVLSRRGGRKTPWQLRDEAVAAVEAEIAAARAAREMRTGE